MAEERIPQHNDRGWDLKSVRVRNPVAEIAVLPDALI